MLNWDTFNQGRTEELFKMEMRKMHKFESKFRRAKYKDIKFAMLTACKLTAECGMVNFRSKLGMPQCECIKSEYIV